MVSLKEPSQIVLNHNLVPGPSVGPIIWSENRQELCESLPYYRSYHSGCYVSSQPSSSDSVLKRRKRNDQTLVRDSISCGYLLAGWPSQRDIWSHDGKVIISHGGGKNIIQDPKQSQDSANLLPGQLMDDQTQESSTIAALIHSMKSKIPIVLIVAENYALLPFKLQCGYAILGWYIITDSWAEKEVGNSASDQSDSKSFVRCKFRFEWIEKQGQPWWTQKSDSVTPIIWDPRSKVQLFSSHQKQTLKITKALMKRYSSEYPSEQKEAQEKKRLIKGPMESDVHVVSVISSRETDQTYEDRRDYQKCASCEKFSPTVFDVRWFCLSPNCPQFFILLDRDGSTMALDFSASFLAPRGDSIHGGFLGGQPPFSLIPDSPSYKTIDQAKGLWCKKCGRLSCRETLYRPKCAHCDHYVGPKKPLPLVAPPILGGRHWSDSLMDPIVNPVFGIKRSIQKTKEGLLIWSFTFPECFGNCSVHVVQADVDEGFTETEADELFQLLQEGAWPKPEREEEKEGGDKGNIKKGKKRKKKRKRNGGIQNPSEMENKNMVQTSGEEAPSDDSSPSNFTTETESSTLSSSSPLPCSIVPQPPFVSPTPTGESPIEQPTKPIPFRRHPLSNHGSKGRLLTQQFTCNYGAAYKHVVAMGTEPLSSSCPQAILRSLSLLHKRTSAVYPFVDGYFTLPPAAISTTTPSPSFSTRESVPSPGETVIKVGSSISATQSTSPVIDTDTQIQGEFNELYPVLYLQHQKMSYHDDGEPGLGPIISSLSLGSSCTMKFKLKNKFLSQKSTSTAVALNIQLRHGSVCIQSGESLQTVFQHSIVPNGFRIACTARRINPLVNSAITTKSNGTLTSVLKDFHDVTSSQSFFSSSPLSELSP